MTPKWTLAFPMCAILALGLAYTLTRPHGRKQPRVYVGDGKYGHWDWANNFRGACPHMAFVTDEKVADYSIQAVWSPSRTKWFTWAERRDTALIHQAEGPDYVEILRNTCRLIRADLDDWALADGSLPQDKPVDAESFKANADRYELRDVRNGNVVTSAILDRQTGRVWVWTNTKGKNGNESSFMAENVYSYVQSPKPDPNAEIPQK
jgi:hypothetical protein